MGTGCSHPSKVQCPVAELHVAAPEEYVIRRTEDVLDHYEIGKQLGKGQFGVVSRAVEKSTGKIFAVKEISKRKAKSNPHFTKDVRSEVSVLFHLVGHPNVVQLHEVFEDEHALHLVMELCEGGDWFERLIASGTYSEDMAAVTVRKMLESIAYCHSLGVVHRDIKPENMIYVHPTDDSEIKLTDFGLSSMLPSAALTSPSTFNRGSGGEGSDVLTDPVGTPYYVAPEVICGQGYGRECDVWSMGVAVFIALGGYPPFNGVTQPEVFYQIKYTPLEFTDETWLDISDEAKDFIVRMLVKDPSERATIPGLLTHPLLPPPPRWGSINGGAFSSPSPGPCNVALLDPSERATIPELLIHPWLAPPKSGEDGRLPRTSSMGRRVCVPDVVVGRLQRFAAMNRFQREARRVLASFLPPEEVLGLLSIFRAMDADGNGLITLTEMQGALHRKGLRLPDDQAKTMLACADINSDGVIDYEEFLAATVHQQRLDNDELMFKAFQEFDTDGSGFIGREELAVAMAKHGGPQEDLDKVLADIDTDRDGRINYEEFCACFRKHEEAAQEKGGFGQLVKRSMREAVKQADEVHRKSSELYPGGVEAALSGVER
ncbi:hypothetical protein FOA52_003788 [Chlamydomonas sp. UWO 241]|nr:hypothetical protein FOA52_003788 [Chlamydomonas sp. UWO 241]